MEGSADTRKSSHSPKRRYDGNPADSREGRTDRTAEQNPQEDGA